MLFTSSISPLSFENTAPPQEHKRNLRLLLWRQGRIGLDNPLDALRMTNDPSAHCQVKCAIPQATDRSSEQVRSHFPTNAERRSRKSYPGTTRIVRHSQNPQMRCPSLSHPDPVETTCESNSPSPCPSPLGRLTLYHLASTSVVPPSLLRPSSVPPPNANRRKDGGATEERRWCYGSSSLPLRQWRLFATPGTSGPDESPRAGPPAATLTTGNARFLSRTTLRWCQEDPSQPQNPWGAGQEF